MTALRASSDPFAVTMVRPFCSSKVARLWGAGCSQPGIKAACILPRNEHCSTCFWRKELHLFKSGIVVQLTTQDCFHLMLRNAIDFEI